MNLLFFYVRTHMLYLRALRERRLFRVKLQTPASYFVQRYQACMLLSIYCITFLLLRTAGKLVDTDISHAKENMSHNSLLCCCVICYFSVLFCKQKEQELCSRLTAQCMYWCLVRYFWTFLQEGTENLWQIICHTVALFAVSGHCVRNHNNR